MAADGLLEQWAIARTKLRAPAPPARVLVRERIGRRLAELVEHHALTLVSAPAGWGKTTAASAWFRDWRLHYA